MSGKNIIASYLHKHFSLSKNASDKFAEIMSIEEIESGHTFVKRGRDNLKEFLVWEGICRSYLSNTKGEDVSLSFYTSNTAISPNLTRVIENKSIINIETVVATKIISFPTNGLIKLMMEDREIELWANSILQGELLKKVKKEINQNSMTAKERLLDFRTEYPSLENQIPHSYIASYLGITNVSLSRLRNEIAKN